MLLFINQRIPGSFYQINYKMHLKTVEPAYGEGKPVTAHDPALLFDLAADLGERNNVAAAHAEVLEQLAALVMQHRASIKSVPSQLEIR